MKSWVQICTEDLNNTEMVEIHFPVNVRKYDSNSKGVLFVFAHHPIFLNVHSFFRNHHHLLHMNEEFKRVFTTGPMVSFIRLRNLISDLVRVNL